MNGQRTSPVATGAEMPMQKLVESLKVANELWLKKDTTNGIPIYERLLGSVEKTFGMDSSEAGLVLLRIGVLYGMRGDFEKAVPNLERSRRLTESLPDNDQNKENRVNLCWVLGQGYKSILKHDQAIQAFNQALTGREQLSGQESPKLVGILMVIADLHTFFRHQPSEAIPLLQRALTINEKSFGSDSIEAAEVLASLGNTKGEAGDLEGALVCLKRSLVIREKALGKTHIQVGIASHNLGSIYSKLGDEAQALPLLERAVSVFEKNAVTNDLQFAFMYAGALNQLGVAELGIGYYEKGTSTLRRSLVVTESNFGGASINLVSTLSSLAVAYHHQGNLERALAHLERAQRILENAPAHKARELVDGLNSLATLFRNVGDASAAERLFNRSLEMAERQFGGDYVSVADSLNGLALINKNRGERAKALTQFERALRIFEKSGTTSSQRDIAVILNNMSVLFEEAGDRSRALSTLQRALAIQTKILPEKHPALATTLNNLGDLYSQIGAWGEANDALQKSVDMTDALYGKDNPDSCTYLENLAIAETLNGERAKGLSDLLEAARRRRRYVVGQMTFQESSSGRHMQGELRMSWDWFHSFCRFDPGALAPSVSAAGAEHLAFSKALLEEIETVTARLAVDQRAQVQELRQQSGSIRKRLSMFKERIEQAAWLEERMAWRSSERDKLEHEFGEIEERIATASELVAQTIRDRDLVLADIVHSLPTQAALIDLVQYRRSNFRDGTNQWKEARYAAYLTFPLAKDSTNLVVERVDLGEAAPIDAAVETITRRMSAGEYRAKDLAAALQRVSELMYAPLARQLTNFSHLIVCPDGQLSRLPFEMLPVAPGGKYLIEEKTISYVGSGREIVRLAAGESSKSKVQSSKSEAAVSKSLVMGNPDFDLDLSARSSRREEAPSGNAERGTRNAELDQSLLTSAATKMLSRSYRGQRFAPLPGAGEEARAVAKLLGNDCVLRLGAEAREAELKAVQSPRVLHLATHGFYEKDQEFKRTNAPNAWQLAGDFTARRSLSPPQDDWENPLLRCGIALAGANHFTNSAFRNPHSALEDGLLTGLEASLLNLQGTELVILSACDSGSGEVKTGEGVMSLRRAFRIAGAESVLASHWKVSDQATSRLMTEFMRRWRGGAPRAQAWREAQLSLLRSKDFSNPYYWAAFTLTGQWR